MIHRSTRRITACHRTSKTFEDRRANIRHAAERAAKRATQRRKWCSLSEKSRTQEARGKKLPTHLLTYIQCKRRIVATAPGRLEQANVAWRGLTSARREKGARYLRCLIKHIMTSPGKHASTTGRDVMLYRECRFLRGESMSRCGEARTDGQCLLGAFFRTRITVHHAKTENEPGPGFSEATNIYHEGATDSTSACATTVSKTKFVHVARNLCVTA